VVTPNLNLSTQQEAPCDRKIQYLSPESIRISESSASMKKDLLYDSAFRTDTQILRSIIDRSVIPSFIINQDHLVLYWNKALEELSRIPATEVIGTSQHWKAFYSQDRPCMADLLVDGKIEKIPEWYKEKFSESKLVDEALRLRISFLISERGVSGSALPRQQSATKRVSL